MPAVAIVPADLEPFAPGIDPVKAQAMIDDALAMAARVAPCILTDAFEHGAAAKAVLRAAILRWNEAGTGAVQQQTTGPFSMSLDTRTPRRSLFWPSELDSLRELCKTSDNEGAFSIDTLTGFTGIVHSELCALNFGAAYCSCGAVLTGNLPLYDSIGDY
jgi:hypothetical protein